MRRLNGFSLMEMMIVLLITAIIAAATAPMINRKMLENQAANTTPWVYTSDATNDIAFNLAGKNQTATIGALKFPLKSTNGSDVNKPAMFIKTAAGKPQITFGDGSNNLISFAANNNSIYLTKHSNIGKKSNNVIIGAGAKPGDSNDYAIAIGAKSTTASANQSIAIGNNTTAGSASAIAIGSNSSSEETKASLSNTIAIGGNASSTNSSAIALGKNATASGSYSLAIGAKNGEIATSAIADKSIAIGTASYTTGDSAIALGNGSSAKKAGAIAIGNGATASIPSETGTAIVSASSLLAIGNKANASGDQAVAMGAKTTAKVRSVAIGPSAHASGADSIAIGSSGLVEADTDGIPGNNQTLQATASKSIAIGHRASATNDSSVAMGANAKATGQYSTAFGPGAKASGDYSTAIGNCAVADKEDQIVLGNAGTTVYIPGNLVVDRYAVLGYKKGFTTFLRIHEEGHLSNNWVARIRNAESSGRRLEYGDGYNGEVPGFSDRRLKNIDKAFTGGLEEIKKLEVFNYTFKKDPDKTPHVGVMAQDLEKIFPKAVFKGDDGFLRIRMEDMFYALVNAVKELSNKIDSLMNKEIATLQKQVSELEKQNQEIKELNEDLIKRIEKLEKAKK
ncbi:MAG: prepilin-type N-terminal cleavage/methylation domain-containing protein [Cyanobacteria bacterium SIG31]|nr:prepilin-type N-terminal cleavage/methylation domain-containing protein [Cyanobacteria bacterium SIG31]